MYDKQYSQQVLRTRDNDIIMNYDAVDELIIKHLDLASHHHVLEVGCDEGYTQRRVEPLVERVVGVDVNADAVAANPCADARVTSGPLLDFEDASFDRVYSSHTIEHIPELEQHFEEVARMLKPGGVYVAVYPWELFRGMAAMRAAMTLYGNPWRSREMHVNKLTPRKLDALLTNIPLSQSYSTLKFMNTPQWLSVWKKSV